jgi:hypothetical protein
LGFIFNVSHGLVNLLGGNGLLAVLHNVIDKLSYQGVMIDWIWLVDTN